MRLGLDLRYVSDHFPGIGRYTMNLARALARIEHDHTLLLLHNPTLPNTRHTLAELREFPGVVMVAIPISPFSLEEQVRLPNLVRALELDVLHSPYYIKPYLPMSCASVVTVHDLIGRLYPQVLSPQGRYLFRMTMGLAVRTATRIITVSESSRRDIVRYYDIPAERIAVTLEAADQRFAPQPPDQVAAVGARYGLPPNYVLYLGANKPHKNLERLVLAWEQVLAAQDGTPPPPLVLAGHHDPRYPEARRLVTQRGLGQHVRFVPDVAEADVPALYSGAQLFVFPSFYEGFGLPPLEAMACGTPVLCSAASSLPEVVGEAALLFDPSSVPDLTAGLLRLLRDADLRARLAAAGRQQSRLFAWERTAHETLAVYAAAGAG